MPAYEDNERFLTAKDSKTAYLENHAKLLHIPPRSHDLNPIKSFWGWLRKELRRRDLEDLRLDRPPLSKAQYKQRLKQVLGTAKAQKVAKAKFRNLKRVCKEVVQKKGAMSRQ